MRESRFVTLSLSGRKAYVKALRIARTAKKIINNMASQPPFFSPTIKSQYE
jgi:hypothetical protein